MLTRACLIFHIYLALAVYVGYGFEEPGLYDDVVEVAYLDHENFYNVVLTPGRAWLVQFYNSWCGHCMDFAPVFQEFARNVTRWRSVVAVGAINCADEKNIAVCRANKIEAYPTMKAGPPNATSVTDFARVNVKVRTSVLLVEMLLKYLLTIPYHLPSLQPLLTVDDLWKQLAATNAPHVPGAAVFLVEEGPESFIGSRIIMDTFGGTGLTVFRMVKPDLTDVQVQKVDVSSNTLSNFAKGLTTYEELASILLPFLVASNDTDQYLITKRPKVTVAKPVAEAQKPFTDEEIVAQLAIIRASRNVSNPAQNNTSYHTTDVTYLESFKQKGILITMEEYREALVLAWRKRLEPHLSTTVPSTTSRPPDDADHERDAVAGAGVVSQAAGMQSLPVTSSVPKRHDHQLVVDAAAALDGHVAIAAGPVASAAGPDGHPRATIKAVQAAAAAAATTVTAGTVAAAAAEGTGWLVDAVQLSDLLYAVRKSIGYEIPLRIQDDNATQLAIAKQYVKVLAEYLPCPAPHRDALRCLSQRLDAVGHISSSNWSELYGTCQLKELLERDSSFASCKGSTTRYRGYPCTMWTMFHTLTVAEADVASRLPAGSSLPPRVLVAMKGYLGTFFGCTECSHNFVAMANALNLTSAAAGDESVLWLWTAHNRANARLRGARSEDPEHRKQQYPPVAFCPDCHQKTAVSTEGTWSVNGVLSYLKSHYSWSSVVSLPGLSVERPPLPVVTGTSQQPMRGDRLVERLKAAAAVREAAAAAAAADPGLARQRVVVDNDYGGGGGRDEDAVPSEATAAGMPLPQPGGDSEGRRKNPAVVPRRLRPSTEHQAPFVASDGAARRLGRDVADGKLGTRSGYPFKTRELPRLGGAAAAAAASSSLGMFGTFTGTDVAAIALLYGLCGCFIAIFYYHFVVVKRTRIKIL